MLEADRKRDEIFLKHREQEAEHNREHEIKLAEIYTAEFSRMNNSIPQGWQQMHRNSLSYNTEISPTQNVFSPLAYNILQFYTHNTYEFWRV